MMTATALDGWELLAAIIAGLVFLAFIGLLLLMREGRSRKTRIGVFVEREYFDPDTPPEEWPTQH